MSELRTEAHLLLTALEERLVALRSLVPTEASEPSPEPTPTCAHCGAAAGASGGSGPGPAGGPAPATTGCPLCLLLAVLRGERPDLAGTLLDGAVTALQLARSWVSDHSGASAAADDATSEATAATTAVPPAAAQRRPPERIRIS